MTMGNTLKTKFSIMPTTDARWAETYTFKVTDERLAPRVHTGELVVFDPKAEVEAGMLVAVWYGVEEATEGDPAVCLVGILTRITPKRLYLALSLDPNDKPLMHDDRHQYTVHAAVGVVTPVATATARANASVNAALSRAGADRSSSEQFRQIVERLPESALPELLTSAKRLQADAELCDLAAAWCREYATAAVEGDSSPAFAIMASIEAQARALTPITARGLASRLLLVTSFGGFDMDRAELGNLIALAEIDPPAALPLDGAATTQAAAA